MKSIFDAFWLFDVFDNRGYGPTVTVGWTIGQSGTIYGFNSGIGALVPNMYLGTTIDSLTVDTADNSVHLVSGGTMINASSIMVVNVPGYPEPVLLGWNSTTNEYSTTNPTFAAYIAGEVGNTLPTTYCTALTVTEYNYLLSNGDPYLLSNGEPYMFALPAVTGSTCNIVGDYAYQGAGALSNVVYTLTDGSDYVLSNGDGYALSATVPGSNGTGFITYNTLGVLSGVATMTLGVQAYIQQNTSSLRGLIGWGNDFEGTAASGNAMLYIDTDNKLTLKVVDNTNTYTVFKHSQIVSINTWQELSATVSLADQTVTLISGDTIETYTFTAGNANPTYAGTSVLALGDGTKNSIGEYVQVRRLSLTVNSDVIVNATGNERIGQVSINLGTGDNGIIDIQTVNDIHQPAWIDGVPEVWVDEFGVPWTDEFGVPWTTF